MKQSVSVIVVPAILVAVIFCVTPLPADGAGPSAPAAAPLAWVHPGAEAMRENGYSGPSTCTMCHDNALAEITHSVHWYAASEVHNVQGLPDGTWWGMINRECALAGTTATANWTAATDGRFTPQSAGCGMCHIAALSSPPLPAGREATKEEAASIDCLVCHAANYDMQVRQTIVEDADGTRHWGQDSSLATALSITQRPTAEACLRCHEHSFSFDYKRGTPFEPTNDLHAALGMGCTTCHITRQHKIAKGQAESDMLANDLPDVVVACSNCHGISPHQGDAAAELNAHVVRLSCQACHIPTASGIVREEWGKPVKDDSQGSYSALSKYDGIPAITGIWVPTVEIERGHPALMWRVPDQGGVSDAQSWMAFATATRTSEGAKLYPVRDLTQIMLFDKKLKMSQAPGMGFLAKNPKMADFPLLLAPNREVYNTTGNIEQALNVGMKPYEAFGLKWSGEWMSMTVPGTSAISVNHGVKRMGYSCRDCHSPHGVVDFAALGYPPDEVTKLKQPM